MPLYDHACDACGRTTEAITRYEVAEVTCEHCGGEAWRVLSGFQRTPKLWEVDPGGSDKLAGQMVSNGARPKYARQKSQETHRRWRDRQIGNGRANR
jgi:putative FmdB family regulatory protein|tara:strand:+ start:6003 stop:6293 length:291 start_codon:yes stop_codon:yes gene_type:complete